jgi:hypothetical protein
LLSSIKNSEKNIVSDSYETEKEGPEKQFKFRESLLTIMLEIKDFKTIYNMVIASFIILTFSIIFDNYLQHGQMLDF